VHLVDFITQLYQESGSRECEIHRRKYFFHLRRNYIARILCLAADVYLARSTMLSASDIKSICADVSQNVQARKCKKLLVNGLGTDLGFEKCRGRCLCTMMKSTEVSYKAVHVAVYSRDDWLQFILTRVTSENRFPANTFEIQGKKEIFDLHKQDCQRLCSRNLLVSWLVRALLVRWPFSELPFGQTIGIHCYIVLRKSDCFVLIIIKIIIINIIIIIIIIIIRSSSSPLCRVFMLIFLRQTMFLGNTVLQLFCCYYSWCLFR